MMQTAILESGDVKVVKLSGRLDVQFAAPFRKACMDRLAREKVVFELHELSFVGSSGIQSFFQTLEELHRLCPQGVRVVGLGVDFRRIIDLYPGMMSVPVLENLPAALGSF